jgi:DNA polymerase-3 subunit delta
LAVVREADLANALKRGRQSLRGVLVYGGDEARVAGVVDTVVGSVAAPEDVTRLQSSALRAEPVLLDDALRAQSFLGGPQAVLVSDVGDQQAKLVESAILVSPRGNFLVLAAGALGKSSPLRTLCEQAEDFLTVAIYEDKPSDILNLVARKLEAQGLRLSAEAADRFMALCGTDRSLALSEAEKLALFAHGQGEISADDVLASCGDQASFGVDALIDAALSGDSIAADRMMYALDDGDWRSILPLLSMHVGRLAGLRLDADRLGGIEAALRGARPPVFFARKQAFSNQLRAFDGDGLLRAQGAIEKSVEESRRFPALANDLVSRLFFSLAAEARRGLRS